MSRLTPRWSTKQCCIDSLEFLLWNCGMDGSGASIGSGKGKLAVIKDTSCEQMFAFTFISLWTSSWRQYLAFSDISITCTTYLDEAAEVQGHVLLLLCGRTEIAV